MVAKTAWRLKTIGLAVISEPRNNALRALATCGNRRGAQRDRGNVPCARWAQTDDFSHVRLESARRKTCSGRMIKNTLRQVRTMEFQHIVSERGPARLGAMQEAETRIEPSPGTCAKALAERDGIGVIQHCAKRCCSMPGFRDAATALDLAGRARREGSPMGRNAVMGLKLYAPEAHEISRSRASLDGQDVFEGSREGQLLPEAACIDRMQAECSQFGGNDLAGYLQSLTRAQGSRELPLPCHESPAPVIPVRGFANGRETLPGPAHEKERDAFTRDPADCLVRERAAAPGHDDRAQPVDAGGMQ